MMGRNHAIFSASCFLIVLNVIPSSTKIEFSNLFYNYHLEMFGINLNLSFISYWSAGLLMSILCSYLPDLDCKSSFLGKRVPFISIPMEAAFGHRGMMHSLLPFFVVNCLLYFFAEPELTTFISLCFTVGFLSHLLGDFIFGYNGFPLFYPLTKKKVKAPMTFSVNSFTEYVFTWGTLGITLYYYWNHYSLNMFFYL